MCRSTLSITNSCVELLLEEEPACFKCVLEELSFLPLQKIKCVKYATTERLEHAVEQNSSLLVTTTVLWTPARQC